MVHPGKGVIKKTPNGKATHNKYQRGDEQRGQLLFIKGRFLCRRADRDLHYFSCIKKQNKLHRHSAQYTTQRHKYSTPRCTSPSARLISFLL